ncbi:hypothetical protein MT418_003462 [Batrachochytrium dendrobatidis]
MGGTQLWRFLQTVVPTALHQNTAQLKKQPTDHLLMDLTMFIHRSMKADMVVERSLNSSVIASIKSLVQSYKPRQSLFIAIDGAAPIAKLPVQILRRAQYFDKNKHLKAPYGIMNKVHRLDLSPGSAYYGRLELLLKETFDSNAESQSWNQGPYKEFKINGSINSGEGEAKVMKRILELRATNAFDSSQIPETFTMLSGDSDALMHLMVATPDIDCIIQRGWWDSPLSFGFLRKQLASKSPAKDTNRIMHDIAFLTLLLGNDYLDKIQHIGLVKLFNQYLAQQYKKYDTGDIDAKSDGHLVNVEDEGITFDLAAIMGAIYPKSNKLLPSDTLLTRKKTGQELQQTKDYFEALTWNLGLLKAGECPDYNFIFMPNDVMDAEYLYIGLTDWISEIGETRWKTEWPQRQNNASTAREATLRMPHIPSRMLQHDT